MYSKKPRTILAIETSCDETAAAIVVDGVIEIASSLATSKDLHEKTGGVVPEIASRKQLEFILPVLEQTLNIACEYFDVKHVLDVWDFIDAIAVTVGPGLSGSLVVGVEAAKTLSVLHSKPLIPVNHLIGHIYANFINKSPLLNSTFYENVFPSISLVVSGGHTDLLIMKDHYNFEYLGGTLDDAAGECFDKCARILGIQNYLGGAKLSQLADSVDKNPLDHIFPRPLLSDNNFDFSFSGLKTAVKRYFEKNSSSELNINYVAKDIEEAIIEVLTKKTLIAAKKYDAKSVLLSGGVSSNKKLTGKMVSQSPIPVYYPEPRLCTDNAVYIASAAYFKPANLSQIVEVNPNLGVTDLV